MMGALKNFRIDTFPDPVGHFGAPSSHIGISRWCGIAFGERVTLALLGWYLYQVSGQGASRNRRDQVIAIYKCRVTSIS